MCLLNKYICQLFWLMFFRTCSLSTQRHVWTSALNCTAVQWQKLASWTCSSSTNSPSATPGPLSMAVRMMRSNSSGSLSRFPLHKSCQVLNVSMSILPFLFSSLDPWRLFLNFNICSRLISNTLFLIVWFCFHFLNSLSRYSPLHNLPPPPYAGPAYPAVLLLTADHDDRVVPLHTLKYCAALQHGVGSSPAQRQPLMVRVDTRSGHGAGKPTSKAILEDTHIFSFVAETLGLSWKDWAGWEESEACIEKYRGWLHSIFCMRLHICWLLKKKKVKSGRRRY